MHKPGILRPALEGVTLDLTLLNSDDLVCLLEVLAWCPGMRALDLSVDCVENYWPWPFPCASFAKLSSLTKLALTFDKEVTFTVANVLGALVPLKGLAELSLALPQRAVVPAALGRSRVCSHWHFRASALASWRRGALTCPTY